MHHGQHEQSTKKKTKSEQEKQTMTSTNVVSVVSSAGAEDAVVFDDDGVDDNATPLPRARARVTFGSDNVVTKAS